MAEKIKTIKLIGEDGQPVTITAARASAVAGVSRYRLILDERETDSPDMRYIRMFIYPTLYAGTVKVEGMEWPLTCEQVAAMDEEFIATWVEAVQDVNPNWIPKPNSEQEAKNA